MMIPTPVKNAFPSANAAPVKAGRSAPAEGTGAESFQDELVRRRGSDRAERSEATKPQAAKPEPKRGPKSRKPARAGRGETNPAADESEVRAASAGEPDAVAQPAGADETEAAGPQEATDAAAETDAPFEAEITTDPAAASFLVAAQGASAPAAVDSDVQTGGEGSSVEMDEEVTHAVGAENAARPTHATAYHAAGPIDAEGAGEAVEQDDNAPTDSTGPAPALFTDASTESGNEDMSSEEQRRSSARPGAAAVEGTTAGVTTTALEFEPHAAAVESNAHAAGDVEALSAAVTGLGEGKTETRPNGAAPSAGPALAALPAEVRFASDNHETIVTSMRAELMPNGGSMRIRLDPPQLGALQVTVQIQDGLVTASFETSNDEATRLLGHSLNQLKTVLESQGVAVDKLQVQQAPRDTQTNATHDDGRRDQGGRSQEQEHDTRQEQQRREMLQKMWRKLAGGQDPLDLTA